MQKFSTRRALFPPIEPTQAGRLPVSELHTLHYEECGSPDGKPVVVLHGGPGGGINPLLRRFHDPSAYRIVLFDQRGCGRSTPHAELRENTTWDLVADIERLRRHLGIDRWQVFGGSWGSTLALAYAETHPDRVTELVLRGLFTLRRAELLWFYQEGASWLFPEAWEAFVAPIPEAERGDMMSAYHRRLTHEDPDVRLGAALAWSVWEGSTLSLLDDPERLRHFSEPAYALAFARIECHYFVHGGFFTRDGQLIDELHRIAHLPAKLIQGRYDVCTPARTAFEIKRAMPSAELDIVPDAGHAVSEPGIVDALVRATEAFKDRR